MTIRYILFIAIILIAFSNESCKKKETHWQTDIILPLLSSHMDVGDIFGEEYIAGNPDQSMSLYVVQKLELLQTDSVIQVDDTLSIDIYNLPFTFTIPPGQKVIEKNNISEINFGEMDLTKSRAKSAIMKFYVTNTILQPLRVKYQLFSASKNGVIYEVEEKVPAATSAGNAYIIKTIDLAGYDMDLTGPSHNMVNTIYAQTTVWIHEDGDTATVKHTDSVIIVSTFEEFVPQYAYGYLGSMSFDEKSSSKINVFESFKDGSFDLKNTKASIEINNYMGVDFSIQINNIATENTNTSEKINLQHSIIGSSINIMRGKESGIETYPVWPKQYQYDISNSNLDKMIEILPDKFIFDISGVMNPLGNISSGNDFIYFDRGLQANINLDIPLNFSANNLIIEDYTKLNFDEESINSGTLNTYLENMFPFDLDIQFYLLDNNRQIIDSLFSEGKTITAATTNNGVATVAQKIALKTIITQSLLKSLRQSPEMLIRARINSKNQKAYILYEHYGLEIKIVGDVNYEI